MSTTKNNSPVDHKAFVFDIDGVLIRGGQALEGARTALEKLNSLGVPWILLTNGGGMTESDRCEDLNKKLGMTILPGQFMQSHTPFKDFVPHYDRILVVGGDKERCREVAEYYGANDIIIPADIVATHPHITPYTAHTHSIAEDGGHEIKDLSKPFDAIFVFADSRDATTDTQIIVDLLVSDKGVLGTRAQNPTGPAMPIYFSNGDLQWMTDYDIPRLGQGAVITMVEALFKNLTGHDLPNTVIGKPTKITYDYATRVLQRWSDKHIDEIYMVGDNQHSDIRGANDYGWKSVLVRTGVYQDGDPMITNPTFVCDDVLDAVNTALADRTSCKNYRNLNEKVSDATEVIQDIAEKIKASAA